MDAELIRPRSRVVIDNYACNGGTMIRIWVENRDITFKAVFRRAIYDLGLVIRTSGFSLDGKYGSSLVFIVTDHYGNKVADERTIGTAIQETDSQYPHRRAFLYRTCAIAFPEYIDTYANNFLKRYLGMLHTQSLDPAVPIMKQRNLPNIITSPQDVPKSYLNILYPWSLDPAGIFPTVFSQKRSASKRFCRVDEQTSLNSSRYGEERRGSNMYALATPRSPMSRDVGNMVPCLWLDSGASSHMVGDSTILINLRDVPIGRVITTADGSRLAVAKVGDIQTPDIRIQDVFYVPGLQMNLVSVRQLAKSKVVTTFYENHAELWSEGEQIGGAVVDDTVSLYKLRYLH